MKGKDEQKRTSYQFKLDADGKRIVLGNVGMSGGTYEGCVIKGPNGKDGEGAVCIPAALKVISKDLDGKGYSLVREVTLTARVAICKNPCLVKFLDVFDEPDGSCVIATELVEGQTLMQRTKALRGENRLHAEDIIVNSLEIGRDLADALTQLEAITVVHRDIKPANIIIRQSDWRPVLIDFGIGRTDVVYPEEAPGAGTTIFNGSFLGSWEYASPEQFPEAGHLPGSPGAQAQRGNAQSDIYSLGATLWYILTGEVVYRQEGLNQDDIIRLKRNGRPNVAALPPIPELRALLEQMLHPSPPMRPTAAMVSLRLQTLIDHLSDEVERGLDEVPTYVSPAVVPIVIPPQPSGLPEFCVLSEGVEIARRRLSLELASHWCDDSSPPSHIDLEQIDKISALRSYRDALRIVEAINQESRAKKAQWVYRLPTKDEWMDAAGLRADGAPSWQSRTKRLFVDIGPLSEWCVGRGTTVGPAGSRFACSLNPTSQRGECLPWHQNWSKGTIRLVRVNRAHSAG